MWFSKSSLSAVAEVDRPETDEQRLAQLDAAYRAAEKEFNDAHRSLFIYARRNPDARSVLLDGKLFCRVSAMTADPVRMRLEALRGHALARRNELLQKRAQLMKEQGQVR